MDKTLCFLVGILVGASLVVLGSYLSDWSIGRMLKDASTIDVGTPLTNALVGTPEDATDEDFTEKNYNIQTECQYCGKTLSRLISSATGELRATYCKNCTGTV